MSTRATRQPPRKQPASPAPPAAEGAGVVQQVLAERRELLIANERLRLELEDARGRKGRTDPRIRVLEMENRALREELAATRADLERLEAAVAGVVAEIAKASP